jgi:hypothetical protein
MTPPLSERDSVFQQRNAFVAGVYHGAALGSVNVHQIANSLFPLPKIHRLRVVSDSTGVQFRCNAGRLQFRNATFQHWDDDVIPPISTFKPNASRYSRPCSSVRRKP